MVAVAGVMAGVITAINAARGQQRRQHEHERKRHWCEQAARSVGGAEMIFAGLASLGAPTTALIMLLNEDDMEAQIDRATSARTELLTVAALTRDDDIVSLLEEVAFRLESVSMTVAALINTRRTMPDHIDQVADAHGLAYREMREGRGDEAPDSLNARELFRSLRSKIAETWTEVPA